MSFSRRTLSLVTVFLILGTLGVGVVWRLQDGATDADAPDGAAVDDPGVVEALGTASGANQFSTDVPQPVTGSAAVRDTLWVRVTAAGQAEAFRRATVTAQLEGWVETVSVRENQRVGRGTELAVIDSTEYALRVAQARAELLTAAADFRQMILFDDEIEDAAVREERRRVARSRSGLDQAEVALQRAELELARTRITAPFEGRAADLLVVPGQYVTPGTELVTVVDLDPIKVEVQVLESELAFLSAGRNAQVTFAAYPGERFTGRIETINPLVDPESRTGRVTVLLPNPDARVKPGMYAEASLDAEALPDRVMVPRSAILERGEGRRRTMLFVYDESGDVGRAKWRYVNVGRENDTHVELLREGPEQDFVEPGEMVLVDGHHYLAHDTPVRLVEDVAAAEGGRVREGGRGAVALAVAAALTALMPQQASAQAVSPSADRPSSADTLRLSLDDALRLAEGGNPAYRQTENSLGLNPVETRTTWLGELVPEVSLSLFNTAYTGNLQRLGVDNLGNPLENPSPEWVYFSNTTQQLNVSWQFQGLSLFDTHRRQRLVNRERVLASSAALTGLRVDVRRLYMDALEQRELARAEEELVAARELDREVAERLFAMAARTRVDVLNAELAIEQQRLELQRQESAYQRALIALGTTLGLDGPEALALADEPLPIFDPATLDVEALVRRALDANPRLRQSEVAVRQADVAVSQQRNNWWPEVFMGFDVFRRAQERNQGALFDMSFDQDLDQRFFLQLSLPVFNGFFQKRRAAAEASVELDNRQEADREARLEVEEAVRVARLELENQWETLRLAERSHEIAEEALRLAREEYRLGTRSFEDLRSSFDQEAGTRRQVIAARYGFVDALLDLEAAVGGPVGPER